MIKPVNKRVLCRAAPEVKKSIIITKEEKYPVIFDVLAVSDDIDADIIKTGDRIMVEKYYGQEVHVDGENLLMVQLEKIIGVFNELPIQQA